jgi:hypothetical protein
VWHGDDDGADVEGGHGSSGAVRYQLRSRVSTARTAMSETRSLNR